VKVKRRTRLSKGFWVSKIDLNRDPGDFGELTNETRADAAVCRVPRTGDQVKQRDSFSGSIYFLTSENIIQKNESGVE
jgi:hypothetical protein